jgi:hypothetical protein
MSLTEAQQPSLKIQEIEMTAKFKTLWCSDISFARTPRRAAKEFIPV